MARFLKLLRWGSLFLLLGLPPAFAVWFWLDERFSRQESVLWTIIAFGSAGILFGLWILLLSGLRWRVRALTVGGAIAIAGLAAGLLRIRGVTGDLVPLFEWRLGTRVELGGAPPAVRARPRAKQTWIDYPQFLGPNRNATLDGIEPAADWTRSPPRLVWRRPIGAAWSGFVVAGDSAFTQEQRGPEEIVSCYGLLDGEPRWSHADPALYKTVIGGVGPRSTPSVDAEQVYALGAMGLLNCLDRATGRRIWSRDVIAENGAKLNEWGASGSPLLHGDLVFVSAGGKKDRSLVAYRRDSGEPAWHGGTASAGYSSPLLADLVGRTQVLILNHGTAAAHDPATGKVLWEVPWPKSNPSPAQVLPIPGDRVLISSGYGIGCALYQVSRTPEGNLHTEVLWKNLNLKAKFANCVRRDGFVFGLDDGILVCLDLETGARRWKAGRYGHGQMVLAGELLLVTAESGEVFLLKASPERHEELGSFRALDAKTWNTPAFAAPYLVVRNDQEAACYELPMAAAPRR